MDFKKVAEALETIKQFCKENNYESSKKGGCANCPLMGEENCIFFNMEAPSNFEIPIK